MARPYHHCLGILLCFLGANPGLALPPPTDLPEEVLRTEIITEGRSPLDGRPLNATEYAELQQALAQSPYPPQLNPKIRHIVFLLQIRKFLKTLMPL
jgi:hypothetical protein